MYKYDDDVNPSFASRPCDTLNVGLLKSCSLHFRSLKMTIIVEQIDQFPSLFPVKKSAIVVVRRFMFCSLLHANMLYKRIQSQCSTLCFGSAIIRCVSICSDFIMHACIYVGDLRLVNSAYGF